MIVQEKVSTTDRKWYRLFPEWATVLVQKVVHSSTRISELRVPGMWCEIGYQFQSVLQMERTRILSMCLRISLVVTGLGFGEFGQCPQSQTLCTSRRGSFGRWTWLEICESSRNIASGAPP